MKKIDFAAAVAVSCILSSACRCLADFPSDMREAAEKVRGIMPDAERLLSEGKLEEADEKILAVFPEPSRTAAQAFMLANILFTQDPKTSYELHKRAAKELAQEADTQLEWAMEQHRAKEYQGAAESYAAYLKKAGNFAPAYGLMAECLIRIGKTKEAVEAWQKSETAAQGTLEDFESLVCEVNAHRYPHRERAEFLKKASAGSIDDARALIALDLDFPRDWWNGGVNAGYLKKDLALLRRTKFVSDKGLAEILCAGDCGIAADEEGNVGDVLRAGGLLLDAKSTLPESGVLLSSMLASGFSSRAISKAEARNKWGQSIRDRAGSSKDGEYFNVAANLFAGTDQLAAIDRAAWEMTGEVRFAASLFISMESNNELTLDDPALTKAVAKYPENALLQGIVVRLTAKAGKPVQGTLVNAIVAEYAHFSPQGVILRPGAGMLRKYVTALAKELR